MPADPEFTEEVIKSELEAVTNVLQELEDKLVELLEHKARAGVFKDLYTAQLKQCASQGKLELVEDDK